MKFLIELDEGNPADMAILSKLGFNIQVPGQATPTLAATPAPQPAAPTPIQPPPPNQPAAAPYQPPPPATAAAPQPQQPVQAATPVPPQPQVGGVSQAQFADACQQYANKYSPKGVKARFAEMSQALGVNWSKITDIPVERYAEAVRWFAVQ